MMYQKGHIAWNKGKHLSEEHRLHMSLHSATKGKKLSEETRRKMSMARSVKRHYNSKWNKERIIESIILYYKEFGKIPYQHKFNKPCNSVVRRIFGTWNNAIIESGFLPRISPRYRERKDNGNINKRLRFTVLLRDNFTCQYCGRKAPDVVLQVDHKQSFRDGGKTVIDNLITSCWECNIGNSGRSIIL